MNRREFIFALGGVGVAWPMAAHPQQAPKLPVIGFLGASPFPMIKARVEAFRHGLRDRGYVEQKNVVIEWRSAEGQLERLPALASEFVRLKVDVIVAAGGEPPTVAAKEATQRIPVVIVNVGDPVGTGLVSSLARPGGNITGLSTTAGPEIYGKKLALLKEALPSVSRVAFLSNPANSFSVVAENEAKVAAGLLGITLHTVEAANPDQLEHALAEAASAGVGALVVVQDAMFFTHRGRLADLAMRNHLPTIYGNLEHVEAGGFMAYTSNRLDLFRRAAGYVERILKGARPGDLPIEQPTKFELAVNLKTAHALGLSVPPTLLARADEVIE
jgi:putative ABC transport system substrate-binding protein